MRTMRRKTSTSMERAGLRAIVRLEVSIREQRSVACLKAALLCTRCRELRRSLGQLPSGPWTCFCALSLETLPCASRGFALKQNMCILLSNLVVIHWPTSSQETPASAWQCLACRRDNLRQWDWARSEVMQTVRDEPQRLNPL
jgi:hypothetical protein